MFIKLTNVKTTLGAENLDPVNNVNGVNDKILSVFPDCENWSYDQDNDVMYITRPNPVVDASPIGEVDSIDYSIW